MKVSDKVFEFVFEKHPDRKSLGTREIIREEIEVGVDGKSASKLVLGNYSWLAFSKINDRCKIKTNNVNLFIVVVGFMYLCGS